MNLTKDREDCIRLKGNSNDFKSKAEIHRINSALLSANNIYPFMPSSYHKSPEKSLSANQDKSIQQKEGDVLLIRTRNKKRQAIQHKTNITQCKRKEKRKESQSCFHQYAKIDTSTSINLSLTKNKSMNRHYSIKNTKLRPEYNSDIKHYIPNDINKPKGYDDYINQYKIQSALQKSLIGIEIGNGNGNGNGKKRRLRLQKNVSAQEIKAKCLKSDIFSLEKSDNETSTNNNDYIKQSTLMKIEKNQSDIFFNSNDMKSLQKSGEAYLFAKSHLNKIASGDEPGNQWVRKESNPTLMNYTNSEFNILNPKAKCISLNKKQRMLYCNNDEYEISKKRKGISNYLDMTRGGVSISNKNHLWLFEKSKNCFHKRKNLCSSFIDLQKHYKNLVQKPFYSFAQGT